MDQRDISRNAKSHHWETVRRAESPLPYRLLTIDEVANSGPCKRRNGVDVDADF